jgi:hypothetical protein
MKSIHRYVLASTLVLGAGCFSQDARPDDEEEAESSSTGDGMGWEDTLASSSLDAGSISDGDDSSAGEFIGPTGDPKPPKVVEFVPADGTSQVYDETITITFSEPMDQATVEAAFPEASGFIWDHHGIEVEIESSFPFEDEPVLHDLVVPTSVTDLAGNGLAEPLVVTIGLAALESRIETEYFQ